MDEMSFPPDEISQSLREKKVFLDWKMTKNKVNVFFSQSKVAARTTQGAGVYMAAVLEYLTSEVLTGAAYSRNDAAGGNASFSKIGSGIERTSEDAKEEKSKTPENPDLGDSHLVASSKGGEGLDRLDDWTFSEKSPLKLITPTHLHSAMTNNVNLAALVSSFHTKDSESDSSDGGSASSGPDGEGCYFHDRNGQPNDKQNSSSRRGLKRKLESRGEAKTSEVTLMSAVSRKICIGKTAEAALSLSLPLKSRTTSKQSETSTGVLKAIVLDG